MSDNQLVLFGSIAVIVAWIGGAILAEIFRERRRAGPARPTKRQELRLAVRVGQLILQGGSSYPMNVDQPNRFQLVATDKFGNVIKDAVFANVVISGDPALGEITAVSGDTSLFDVVASGKTGVDPLNFSATVNAPGGKPVALIGTLNVPIDAGAPAKLSATDLGPTPAAS